MPMGDGRSVMKYEVVCDECRYAAVLEYTNDARPREPFVAQAPGKDGAVRVGRAWRHIKLEQGDTQAQHSFVCSDECAKAWLIARFAIGDE